MIDEGKKYMKIGMSNNVKERLKTVQTGCPYPLYILRIYETINDSYIEAKLHRSLYDLHVRGEWFKYNEDAIDTLDELLELDNLSSLLQVVRDINSSIKPIKDIKILRDAEQELEESISLLRAKRNKLKIEVQNELKRVKNINGRINRAVATLKGCNYGD